MLQWAQLQTNPYTRKWLCRCNRLLDGWLCQSREFGGTSLFPPEDPTLQSGSVPGINSKHSLRACWSKQKRFAFSCGKPRCLGSIQLPWPLADSLHALLWGMPVITASGDAEALLSRSKLEPLPSSSPWPPKGRICSCSSPIRRLLSREREKKRRRMESSLQRSIISTHLNMTKVHSDAWIFNRTEPERAAVRPTGGD